VRLLTLILTCSPITEAYRSAFAFASQDQFGEFSVTRAEYLESGSNACRRKFKDWRSSDEVSKDESNLKAKSKGKQREESGRVDTGTKTRKISTSTRRR
jgi:actin-related protein 6